MENQVYFKINGKEADVTWGVYMAEGSLAALMSPPPMKEYVTSECALQHGKRVIAEGVMMSDRDLTLTLHLTAPDLDEFLRRYASLCAEFAGGSIDIETRYQPGVVYRCVYISCSEFRQYDGVLGQFSLRLNEPDPSDRSAK